MVHAANAVIERLGMGEQDGSGTSTALPEASQGPYPRRAPPPALQGGERLIRRLAADRLRDLRDDGVTLAYMARMYDVTTGDLRRLFDDLIPRAPR